MNHRGYLSLALHLFICAPVFTACQRGTPPTTSSPTGGAAHAESATLPAPPPSGENQLDINHPLSFAVKNGKPELVKCSERIVEIPFTLRNLPYPFRGRVLDVGYRESEIIYQTASLGFETWGIDIRQPLVEFPGVRYVRGDIREHPLPEKYFEVVIALSTVEHIGLVFYGNEKYDAKGDVQALRGIHRALKPEGRLILTVPFGVRAETKWYRVYDLKALQELLSLSGFHGEKVNFWIQEGLRWVPASWQKAQQIDSVTNKVKAVACVVARPAAARSSVRNP